MTGLRPGGMAVADAGLRERLRVVLFLATGNVSSVVQCGRMGCIPGGDFGPGGEGCLRFCFAREGAELAGAIESMRSIFS